MDEQMFMSADIGEIAAALSAFQGTVNQPKLSKEVTVRTKTGGQYKFKYADLAECISSAKKPLSENGLAVTQIVFGGKLLTMLIHKSGQWIGSQVSLPKAEDAQAFGSILTYLKRYTYCAILGLVADDDDDASKACENNPTFDGQAPQNPTTGDPSMDNDMNTALQQIQNATTAAQLKKIHTDFAHLQSVSQFMSALTARRKALGIRNSNENE